MGSVFSCTGQKSEGWVLEPVNPAESVVGAEGGKSVEEAVKKAFSSTGTKERAGIADTVGVQECSSLVSEEGKGGGVETQGDGRFLSVDQQRRFLGEFMSQPPDGFLSGEKGEWFYQVIFDAFSGYVFTQSRLADGLIESRQEATHTVMVLLAEEDYAICRAAKEASVPFVYIGGCLRNKFRAHSHVRLDQLTFRGRDEGAGLFFSRVSGVFSSQLGRTGERECGGLSSLGEVVERVFGVLAPYFREGLRDDLLRLVWFLAENPPQQRGKSGQDLRAVWGLFPQFSYMQVLAVTSICWGSRRNGMGATSLLGAFLKDAEFDYTKSVSHLRAMMVFSRRLCEDVERERLLS